MEPTIETTQTSNPGRATVRTVVQNVVGVLVGFALVAPAVLEAVTGSLQSVGFEQLAATLTAGSATAAAVAGLAARLMAFPGVEAWLQRTSGFRWLAASAVPEDNGPGDRGVGAPYVASTNDSDENLDVLDAEAQDAGFEGADAASVAAHEAELEEAAVEHAGADEEEGPGWDGEDTTSTRGA